MIQRSPGSRSRPTSAWHEFPIAIAPAALRQLCELDPRTRGRLQVAIELLADHPRPGGAMKLVGGEGECCVRSGDYRIIYEIHDHVLLVLVVAVGHRREICESH